MQRIDQRLVGALKSMPNDIWLKMDAKVSVEWENDNNVPVTAELQLGRMYSPSFGLYVDGLIGIGGDKSYEWGVGVGARFNC
jgi:hypothetical protein